MKELGQDTLFGQKVISTIGYNEQEIIRDILYLHCDGMIECDPTYSVGNFYKNGISKPKYKFDLYPQGEDVIEANANNLPLDKESIRTIMYDPPFVIGGTRYDKSKKGRCIGAKRFTSFTSFNGLKNMYSSSLQEFYRILKNNGIVIFKCQDCVASAKQHFSHCWVMYEAIKIGFYPRDLFILLAKVRLNDGRKQQHARKYHSYYWVLQKKDFENYYN